MNKFTRSVLPLVLVALLFAVALGACTLSPPTPDVTQTPIIITTTPVDETPIATTPAPTEEPSPTPEIVLDCLDPDYSDSECPLNEATMRGLWETETYTITNANGPKDFILMHPAAFDLTTRAIETTAGGYQTVIDGELPTMFCEYGEYNLEIVVNGTRSTGRQDYDAACTIESAFKAAEITLRQPIESPGVQAEYPLIIRVVTQADLNVAGALPAGLVEVEPKLWSTVGAPVTLQAQAVPEAEGDHEFVWAVRPTSGASFVLDVTFRTRYAALQGQSKWRILAVEVYRAPTADYGGDSIPEF